MRFYLSSPWPLVHHIFLWIAHRNLYFLKSIPPVIFCRQADFWIKPVWDWRPHARSSEYQGTAESLFFPQNNSTPKFATVATLTESIRTSEVIYFVERKSDSAVSWYSEHLAWGLQPHTGFIQKSACRPKITGGILFRKYKFLCAIHRNMCWTRDHIEDE